MLTRLIWQKGRCLQQLDCIVVGKSCCAPSGQDVSHAGLDLKAPTLYSMSCQVVSLLDCIRGTFIPGNGTMVRTVFSHVVSVPCVFSVSRSCQSPVEKDSVFGLFSNEAKCVSCSAILNWIKDQTLPLCGAYASAVTLPFRGHYSDSAHDRVWCWPF